MTNSSVCVVVAISILLVHSKCFNGFCVCVSRKKKKIQFAQTFQQDRWKKILKK
jgi:hypothetical protein